MVEPVARIRPFKPQDKKLVQFIVGKDDMEALTVANKKMYFHPLTISIWVALSCVFAQRVGWWPNPEHGYLAYLSPLPAFATIAVPIMFLCDWFNRPAFEDKTLDDLRRPDLLDIPSYYSRSPSSGFWILEYGNKFVGLVAVDASLESTSQKTISSSAPPVKNKDGSVRFQKGTSKTATIRHFYVEEQYRGSGIQDDLLEHAVTQAFSNDRTVHGIRAPYSPLKSYVGQALRRLGFREEAQTERVGLLKWQNSMWILRRKDSEFR